MASKSTAELQFKRRFGGVALGGALAAYFATPLFEFANPVALAATGALTGVGLIGIYNVRVVPGVKPAADKVAWMCLILGVWGIALTLSYAVYASRTVDGFCADLQRRLVAEVRRGKPSRETIDTLQSLRCRPHAIVPPKSGGGLGSELPPGG